MHFNRIFRLDLSITKTSKTVFSANKTVFSANKVVFSANRLTQHNLHDTSSLQSTKNHFVMVPDMFEHVASGLALESHPYQNRRIIANKIDFLKIGPLILKSGSNFCGSVSKVTKFHFLCNIMSKSRKSSERKYITICVSSNFC